jgi:hypothetical protein
MAYKIQKLGEQNDALQAGATLVHLSAQPEPFLTQKTL